MSMFLHKNVSRETIKQLGFVFAIDKKAPIIVSKTWL